MHHAYHIRVSEVFATALLIAVVACSTGEAPPANGTSGADADTAGGLATNSGIPRGPDTPDATLPPRPETIVDTLEVEGTTEVRGATLVRARDGLDLPFSTYVPEGMNAEFPPQPDGAAVRFVAGFAGVVRPEAYMHVHMHSPGTTVAMARDVVTRFLTGKTVRTVDAPAWADEAQGFDYVDSGERYTGRVILARHGARVFHVIQHYPPDYGDGLGPRLHSIMKHWRWDDTGEPLVGGGAARR